MKVPTCGLLATEHSYVIPQNLIWDQRPMDWLLKVKGITFNLPQCQISGEWPLLPKCLLQTAKMRGPRILCWVT